MVNSKNILSRKENYLKNISMDTLRFITCGSVDDGKSTLIGRILYESNVILDDQMEELKRDSKKSSNIENNIDFSLLLDGLDAEREQGITIDIAYRYFNTDKRKFIVADTPGHEQYTRNMFTGASTADVAVLLIDSTKGILEQTKRHAYVCSTLGIDNIILAINKIDLVGYDQDVFNKHVSDFIEFTSILSFKKIIPIPISALKGDNVTNKSQETHWYKGPTLLSSLETIELSCSEDGKGFYLPVQWVNRPNSDFRGFSGTVEYGSVEKGQEIIVLPSRETAHVKEIYLSDKKINKACISQAITLTLDKEIDISRGDILADMNNKAELSDQLEAKLIWMDKEPGYIGRSYLLKIGTTTVNAQIMEIKHKININTYENLPAKELKLNDLCIVTLKLNKNIIFKSYKSCRPLGSFILIDKMSNSTAAAGMINFSLRRSQNIHLQNLNINKEMRQKLNGHKSKILWFTGISGSGKSTIANALEKEYHLKGIRTYTLDGDNIRHGLNKDLGFTNADRIQNIRRIAEVAKLMLDAGIVVLCAFISPFREDRNSVRALFDTDEFIEIFVNTPLDIAEKRDPKGLYKKARKGEIPNFTGIDSNYEEPENPEFNIKTDELNVEDIVDLLESKIDLG
tara:strand:- start:105 stop:1988 length:1884 start_codon:yes stop_codon:yes gene_type:complete